MTIKPHCSLLLCFAIAGCVSDDRRPNPMLAQPKENIDPNIEYNRLGLVVSNGVARPLRTPKAAQGTNDVMMFDMRLLIPQDTAFSIVVPPTALTNIVQGLEWTASPRASGYTLYAGTNQGPPYRWSTNSQSASAVIRFTTRDDYSYLYYAVKATNSTGSSDYSNEVRDQDWDANAVRVSWFPPVEALLCRTADFKFWTCWLATPPITNAIELNQNAFYRCQSPAPSRVFMDIKPLRLWNAAANHFGR